MTSLKNLRWSPICFGCRECCYNFEFDNDPWNLGVERLDEKGNEISGVKFIEYLKQIGGEAEKRISKLRIDESGCIEVIKPSHKTYRDLTKCIFLDDESNCVIHPERINLGFDLRGKLCASYLCEIAEYINNEMPYLKNHLQLILNAQSKKYGNDNQLNLIQYLKKIPKNRLEHRIIEILGI
ncbi:MAG: hypothetical protein EU551_01525 [Promethearchaeota archaeon]|nr:MAG: hypothetical protein EU551_01525 [Candidatus Lokiarchaeota archaeon]